MISMKHTSALQRELWVPPKKAKWQSSISLLYVDVSSNQKNIYIYIFGHIHAPLAIEWWRFGRWFSWWMSMHQRYVTVAGHVGSSEDGRHLVLPRSHLRCVHSEINSKMDHSVSLSLYQNLYTYHSMIHTYTVYIIVYIINYDHWFYSYYVFNHIKTFS